MDAITVESVERAMARIWLGAVAEAGEARLRDEDRKKAREMAAMLAEIARVGRRARLVDAAAGHAYAGLLAAELLGGIDELVLLERDPRRIARAREAAARLAVARAVDARVGDVGDPALWPDAPDVVVALHACGSASDAVADAAVAARSRWLLLVPCCYARDVAFAPRAEQHADEIGVPRQAEVRRPFVQALVDAERTARLESAGYEVTVVPFVPRAVSGHNLLFRCRRVGEPGRMRAAAERLARLRGGARR